ncbi:hypothetical protein ABD91_00070, partial [Lysinibacillus sphaericus]|uniref:retrotransposon gag family protein n=1 Tax=Lysinibacillus sphaericus TaxID=1421 RepID=UPI0019D6A075
MMNDQMFRGFMQFMQQQVKAAPVHNVGGNTGNSQAVTAKQFKELGPPEFKGEPKPLVAETWIKQITKIFDVLGCSEEQKVPFAAFMLRGEADYWWESIKRTQPAALKMSWEKFQELFNDKYFPESIRHMKEVEFIKLEQNNMTVSQYEAKFAELSRFASHLVDNEERMTRMFLRGLKPEIRQHLVSHKLCLYSDVVNRAQLVERDNETTQPKESSRQNDNTSESSHRSGDNKRGGNQQARNGNHFGGNQGQNNKNG